MASGCRAARTGRMATRGRCMVVQMFTISAILGSQVRLIVMSACLVMITRRSRVQCECLVQRQRRSGAVVGASSFMKTRKSVESGGCKPRPRVWYCASGDDGCTGA